ncbi:ABC transporter substrate-binding protein [Bradyrhizobium sp. 24]|uniref:ABC transporter substrate-binding protein n=2 Tax=Bradyrhizobium TaxID=374 RepID=UPI001FFB0095|nr:MULTISPECIES: ABC transporter substrate-binding protein [unclassified Bradyrhizobium]MCK1302011.1 ABC transporter substrate-binding protein [Bradyrhizobium sp. 37]MCK1378612.1 ABC transporter substrate-binding protein [Bradyrhizobium sp. 24]MCK1773408.1 ABC transporter substrate-binding protein [Bradyrhizobium sp. 134]
MSGPVTRRTLLAGGTATLLAAPWVARAQANTLRIGMQSILSGPIALLGTSSRNSLVIEQDRINAAGGFLGRQIEFVFRDSKGQPQEAARVARELVNTAGCELLVDAEASSASFAVQEVMRDLNVACIHTNSETSSLTADPKIRVPTAFRVARQGVHDAVAGSLYLADFANAKKINKWATCSPDYAYGRDTTAQYLQFFKKFKPDVEVVTEAWPKLGQPDFTEVITKLIQAKPQALFTLLYAGDLSAFVNQGNVYALFGQMTVATPNVDYPVLAAIKNLPAGIQSATRYLETFPDTPANKEWGQAYFKRWNERPTNWSWQNSVAMHFYEAAIKKANSLDGKAIAAALTGLKINSPFGADGTITMRDDHTTIGYAIGWGQTIPKDPFISDIKPADWGKIIELETEWKKQQNYS